ncbi:hypothetical protein [Salinimicrobium sp. GXAS 041]|uniref:hypothetical protein n=1 Tax=Salinimicrobium sp. GXAS 041 TaxID=3400806 RepID=UPI003C76B70D
MIVFTAYQLILVMRSNVNYEKKLQKIEKKAQLRKLRETKKMEKRAARYRQRSAS